VRARLVRDYEEVPTIAANEARLGQVFLNLIINATQALPEGRAEENEIRLVTRSGKDRTIVVEVHDTGSGIAPEALGHIFEPFFTTKAFGVGTGLGLSICHGIVAAMGGRITVTTEVGKGSCFRVELPTASDAPGRGRSEPPPPSAPRRGRVLIVDDEPRMCATLEELLSNEHDVVALTSARDAHDRITAGERFDVIVSDLMMPDLSGMDLYAELSRIAPEQAGRMIFLTGGAFTQRARDFVAEVKNTFLDKPFDVATLRALIRARL
jgi:CheY-like chemotaxis protein